MKTVTESLPSTMASAENNQAFLQTLRRYFAFVAPAHLVWEFGHIPLYTIWQNGSAGEIVFAAVHCTGGDILIATWTLVFALLIVGTDWPEDRGSWRRVTVLTVVFGVAYTIFSEWMNIVIRAAWEYNDAMPVVPLLGTGLTPLFQWIFIPIAGLWWARRPVREQHRKYNA